MPPEPDDSHLCTFANSLTSQQIIASACFFLLMVLLCAYCTYSDACYAVLAESNVREAAEKDDRKAKTLLKWIKIPSRFTSLISLGTYLTGFLGIGLLTITYVPWLCSLLIKFFGNTELTLAISLLIVVLVSLYFFFVFGILFPKKIFASRPLENKTRMPRGFRLLRAILFPIFTAMNYSAKLLLRMCHMEPAPSGETVTTEEILKMVDVGEENGVIEESAKDMIENIMDFGDTVVSEIMTHRTEVKAVEDSENLTAVVSIAMEDGYSRIPVYHNDIDDIRGILYVKDLLKYIGHPDTDSVRLTDIMRPVLFVPEFKRCSDLFTEMTEKKIQMAVICDEYGGTAGIVTMEDLLESIVGNIQDEYDHEEEEISCVNENTFTVDGGTGLDEISDLVQFELPQGDYDTIAGMVVNLLGYIPSPEQHPAVTVRYATFTVMEVEDQRISKILIELSPEKQREEAEAEAEIVDD